MLSGVTKFLMYLLLPVLLLCAPGLQAQEVQEAQQTDDSLVIMEAFKEQAYNQQQIHEMTEQDQHEVLFFMGAALLLLLVATAYFGVNMVVFDKPYFVQHMVCAGLTVTLGIAHAVAAVVWFYPF